MAVLAVGIFGAALFFRSQISEFLSFAPTKGSFSVVEIPTPSSKETPPPLLGSKESGNKAESSKKTFVPIYIGRDPAEIRPVPEEVKLFTELQKEQLYSTLKTHATAVKRNPTYFEGWIQVGMLKKTIGDFEGARDAWEYVSLIEPLNSLSFANLGELYWRYLRDFPKAEENLKTSIKHKPNDFQTYLTLSDLYYYSYQEKADQADKVLLDGIEANLDNIPVKSNLMRALARLYENKKELAKALEWWQKVLDTEPGNTEVAATIENLKKKINP